MTDTISTVANKNGLLARLSAADSALLAPLLHPVRLKFRQRLELANRRIRTVYFVESGLVSVVAIGGRDRRQAEIGIIGREGMTGLPVVLGLERSPHEMLVQGQGAAQCVTAADLRDALDRSPSLLNALLGYVHVWNVNVSHTALANAHGTVDQRLARWLLMAHDRSDGNEIHLTHDLLSLMLGTRRAGVTTALNSFNAEGLISHSRGCITIVDRHRLQDRAGGYYGIPEAEYRRVFEGVERVFA